MNNRKQTEKDTKKFKLGRYPWLQGILDNVASSWHPKQRNGYIETATN